MNERYDDFDRALLRAGKKAAAPTSRMRARALGAAAAVGGAGAATAATATTKAAAATKVGALAKATKVILAAKWTMVAAVTTASIGTAVYVAETRVEQNEPAVAVTSTVMQPGTPTAKPLPAVAAPPPVEETAEPAPSPIEPIEPIAPVPMPKVTVTAKPAPVVASPSASASASARTIDPLREELGLLEEARRALASGDAATALRHVDEHARRYPSGAFTVEREVMRRRIAKMTETNP